MFRTGELSSAIALRSEGGAAATAAGGVQPMEQERVFALPTVAAVRAAWQGAWRGGGALTGAWRFTAGGVHGPQV